MRGTPISWRIFAVRTEVSGTATFGASIDFVVDSDHEKDFLQVKANAPNAPALPRWRRVFRALKSAGDLVARSRLRQEPILKISM